MEFGLLGPVAVWDGGHELRLDGRKQRALLSILLLRANEVVAMPRLVDALWGEEPPDSAVVSVQVYVSRLRKVLGNGVLLTEPAGYRLHVGAGALDAERFESLYQQGRELLAGTAAREAAVAVQEALALWRGPPLAGFELEEWASNEIGRLEALRLAALELRLSADLALGLHTDVVGELTGLVRDHPLRESLRGLLMLALYRSGRQADALAAYQEGRKALVDGLGLDPSADLQRLELQILRHDPSLDLVVSSASAPPEPTASPPPVATDVAVEARKIVTILFCDVAVEEEADPEALRGVLSRAAELVAIAVLRHGAAAEEMVGGGVLAVFGVPSVHEDDAIRALHAAAEIQDSLSELGVQARIGISSGEVITARDASMTGSVVAAGRRLEGAAAAGDVLVGELTVSLVGNAADFDPVALDGSAGHVAAYRLLAVRGASERDHGMRFVGRENELTQLGAAWTRVQSGQQCELVTLLGEGGIGKTRLAEELLATIDAQIVRGRCLPYGEAITYWPVVEMLQQLTLPPSDEAAGVTVRSLLDKADSVATPGEIAWAFRKTLERAATGQPLVAVFDDIHWGEETLLDLIEHVALLSSGAAILVVCMARPVLVERRASWPVTLRLEPLHDEEVNELLPASLGERLRAKIARTAGGNPLFIQEMVAMAAEHKDDDVAVPRTLQAVLSARLDQLEPSERSLLGRGSIEGEIFHRGAIEALADDAPDVISSLASLVRKGLIRPDQTHLKGDDGFRFRHLLIRDAAYNALPKATRADLHERFATWLEVHGVELVSLDELLGHHLEQSYRYRTELEPPTDATRELGEGAASRLAPAGRRALARGDVAACVNLLERAVALGLGDPYERTRVQVDLAYALGEIGRMAESDAMLASTIDAATGLGAHDLAQRALVQRLAQRVVADPDLDPAEVTAAARAAVDTLDRLDDPSGVALAERLLALALACQGRSRESRDALERALARADVSGDQAVLRRVVGSFSFFLAGGTHGAWPAGEAIDRCHDLLASGRCDRVLEALLTRSLSALLAMAGRFEEAREHLRRSDLVLDELEQLTISSVFRRTIAETLELIGDRPAAEQERVQRYLRLRAATGGRPDLMAMGAAIQLASFYCDEGRWDEAAECHFDMDVPAQTFYTGQKATWLAVEARLAAHEGRLAEALALARRAAELAMPTENLDVKANVQVALAEVQRRSGRSTEADAAIETAIRLYEQRGNVTAADRLRARSSG